MPLDLSNGTCQVAHWECGDSGLGYALFPGGVEGTLAQKSACSGDPNDVFSNCTLNSFPPPPRPRVSRTYTECTPATLAPMPRSMRHWVLELPSLRLAWLSEAQWPGRGWEGGQAIWAEQQRPAQHKAGLQGEGPAGGRGHGKEPGLAPRRQRSAQQVFVE